MSGPKEVRSGELAPKGNSVNERHHSAARGRGLPVNWRVRLPDPACYYASHLADLSETDEYGWASAACPFYEGSKHVLRVHIEHARGAWRCTAGCGGGDLVGFHMRRTHLTFQQAVADLVWGYR